VLAQASYYGSTGPIRTLESRDWFGAAREFVFGVHQLHFFSLGGKGPRVLSVQVALKVGAKVWTDGAMSPFIF